MIAEFKMKPLELEIEFISSNKKETLILDPYSYCSSILKQIIKKFEIKNDEDYILFLNKKKDLSRLFIFTLIIYYFLVFN